MAAAGKAAAKPRTRRTSATSTAKTKQARSKDERTERQSRTELSIAAAAKAGAARSKQTAKRKADDPPADLPTAWVQHWRSCRARLVKDRAWHPTVRPLLDQMVRGFRDAEEARAAAEEEPFVEGSMGQLTDHPGFARADKAEDQALKIADRLLLTPAARRRAKLNDGDEDKDAMSQLLDGD